MQLPSRRQREDLARLATEHGCVVERRMICSAMQNPRKTKIQVIEITTENSDDKITANHLASVVKTTG